ncbi:hypothetical protein SEVIR_6G088700v4 [Setaria viridis]|uniref:Uncharacterized protein n=2 Tax=Setaria TaxID=4554 RepID=A0A368RJK2_SETIT|nr:hypothetical protein SETIT_6G089600v2 [Setaria italica]TKW09352.1 hypothetical protein SEVIR_6G088700v2 [Setaria viridis]
MPSFRILPHRPPPQHLRRRRRQEWRRFDSERRCPPIHPGGGSCTVGGVAPQSSRPSIPIEPISSSPARRTGVRATAAPALAYARAGQGTILQGEGQESADDIWCLGHHLA